MESTVIVKPAPNGKPHFMNAKQKVTEYNGETGEEKEIVNQKFEGYRFPGTNFFVTVSWSLGQRKWLLDMDPTTLNEYVERCKFSYERGPKKGLLIKEADVYDQADAFFTHSRQKVKSEGGIVKLDPKNPKDYLIYQSLKLDRRYHTRSNGPMPGTVKFIITDTATDSLLEITEMNQMLDAMVELKTMAHVKRVAIGASLGLPITDKTDPDTVTKILKNFIENEKRNLTGKYNREIFLTLAKDKQENLEIKQMIAKGKSSSVLRFKKNEGYYYNGELVAKDDAEMETFLKSPNNREVFDKIIAATEEKSK